MSRLRRRRGRPSSGEGDALLAAADQGDPVAAAQVVAYRAEGATDDDIRSWWNLSGSERQAVLDNDETSRLALFIHLVEEQSLDPKMASQEIFKVHARYGDPQDATFCSGEDRPLPIVLKDRVNRYVESRMNDPLAFKKELEASTSFNAYIRSKFDMGQQHGGSASPRNGMPVSRQSPSSFSEATLRRLQAASAKCSFADLEALFAVPTGVVQTDDFDQAVTVAIDWCAQSQNDIASGDGNLQREIGSDIVSGYLIGRRLFGTHKGLLKYSLPEEIADNATALLNGLPSCAFDEILDVAGPAKDFFERWVECYSGVGRFGDLDYREGAAQLMGVCLFCGLYISVAETELFG